ncbi:MAG: flavin reductase family protein [Synergistaceae bacterium]|nr:flavin reductase family protein [Synergistaceae bacterium]
MKKNIGPKLGIYPTPVVVVGTYDTNNKPNLVTLAWAGVCCSEPPSVQISIRKSRHTHPAIVERKAFSVNIPSAKYLLETDYVGIVSGKDADKFNVTKLTPVRGESVEAPLVLEFPISMECKLTHTLELGSHDLFVGEIVACWVAEEVLLGGGRLDSKKIDPLVFTLSGEYFGIGELLSSSHGVGKKLMEK